MCSSKQWKACRSVPVFSLGWGAWWLRPLALFVRGREIRWTFYSRWPYNGCNKANRYATLYGMLHLLIIWMAQGPLPNGKWLAEEPICLLMSCHPGERCQWLVSPILEIPRQCRREGIPQVRRFVTLWHKNEFFLIVSSRNHVFLRLYNLQNIMQSSWRKLFNGKRPGNSTRASSSPKKVFMIENMKDAAWYKRGGHSRQVPL